MCHSTNMQLIHLLRIYFINIFLNDKSLVISYPGQDRTFQVVNISDQLNSNSTHISLDDIDLRITQVITNPERNSTQQSLLMADIYEYYHYLSKITESINKEDDYKLLHIVLSHPPQFIAVHYDDDRLKKAFSWTDDQLDDFNRAFDGSYLLWQRLRSMGIV